MLRRVVGALGWLCLVAAVVLVLGVWEPSTVENWALEGRLAGPVAYDDPDLLHLVAKSFLHPPATQPYNLMLHKQHTSSDARKYYTFQTEDAYKLYATVIKELFPGVRGGFFVEAGALDGEFLSNTLTLELQLGWTGLLVEADGDMFQQLLQKRRRAWASHTCLATHQYPHRDTLVKNAWENRDLLYNGFSRAHGSLFSSGHGVSVDGTKGYEVYESVQCLPLASLLLALNVTHVDMVSLDVEGAEMGILQHFPWDRITVDVWLVEHKISPHNNTLIPANLQDYMTGLAQNFIDFFDSRGYRVFRAGMTPDLSMANVALVRRRSSLYPPPWGPA